MENHDLESISAELPGSLHEAIASDRTESETLAGSLQALLQISRQLNEYCDRAVADIRASLERNRNEEH
ncbi:hypothetical protein [Bradyrhizobium sp. dw_78]|uniref:hypothetical protein n=1 Tax=Bradyrhizobium sp. dw_78 TaxID=2719793 RepID=UPI001BD6BDAF|nr:hypothetical protein [Bradyrhizobium sp. dw_78]